MEVDGRETSASICYTIRTIDDVTCDKKYSDEKTCLNIPLTPIDCGPNDGEVTGTIQTEGGDITYTITQRHYDCKDEPECECSCDIIDKWTIPHYISDDYDGEINVYCEYWYTSADTEGNVCSRERKIVSYPFTKATLPVNPIGIVVENECNNCFTNVYTAKTVDECESTPSTSLTVSFSTLPTEVPGSGGTITVVCNYKRVVTDDRCNEVTDYGILNIKKTVRECSSTNIDCCIDNMVDVEITQDEIKGNSGLKMPDAKIFYNNQEVSGNIIISVKRLARTDGKCDGICDYVTTYCVNKDSVKIWYESQFGRGDWQENGKLPMYGGRIKVTWDYTAHTVSSDAEMCPYTDTETTYEEIMLIGDCRDPDHPESYEITFKPDSMQQGCDNTFTIVPEQDECEEPTPPTPPTPSECNCETFKFNISKKIE